MKYDTNVDIKYFKTSLFYEKITAKLIILPQQINQKANEFGKWNQHLRKRCMPTSTRVRRV